MWQAISQSTALLPIAIATGMRRRGTAPRIFPTCTIDMRAEEARRIGAGCHGTGTMFMDT